MKKIILVVVIALIGAMAMPLYAQGVKKIAVKNAAVTDSLYNYDSEEFLKLEKLNEPIDFESPDVEILNAAIFHLTNKERKKKKRSELIFSAELGKAAQFHSEQMRDQKFYSHENAKDKEFYSLDDRIRYFGGNFRMYGENINDIDYKGQWRDKFFMLGITPLTYGDLAKKIVRSWMSSSGHRANILDLDFKFLGCGTALPINPHKRKKYIYIYSTQDFGG